MLLISMWFLQFRKNSIPLSTATRNSYTLLFIMRLQILSVNLLLIVNILGLISAISVSSIHGGSTMNFHPHIHAIVLGGGLDVKNHWKDNGKDFFLPIKVISKTFRGKYMAELKQLWENDRLEFHGSAAPYKNYYTFKELLNTCYAKEWIPYCKKPFDGAESVIRYLGKYTHRIAISNYRIKDMTESTVTFSAKDYKNQGLWKEITISGEEFIRRFLMHVPPKRFVRIRHYGLLSSRNKKKKITLCRNILGCKKYISKLKDMDAPAIIRLLYNKDICKCSSCGGKIIPLPTEQHFIKPKPHMLC